MPRIPFGFVALALMLAVGIGVVVGANAFATAARQTAVAPITPPARIHAAPLAGTSRPTMIVTYRQVVANLAAAEERHDFAAQARFESQLDELMTPAVIGKIYQERERLLAALAASDRDSHAALITREIAKLCGPAAVKAQLTFCN
jgi:hypothetical protein